MIRTHHFAPLIALAMAWSAPKAWGQEVAFADLNGVVIELRVVAHETVAEKGSTYEGSIERNVKIEIGPGERIVNTYQGTWHGAGGARKGIILRSERTLERPGSHTAYGGGDAVWTFKDGALTWLQVYKMGGGFKRTIAFERGPKGITCTVADSYVRENGVGRIVFESTTGNRGKVEIINEKQLSSRCSVRAKAP
jgi:hypothetical protein